MRETGAPALREQWIDQAAAMGMTIEEILEGGSKTKRSPPPCEPLRRSE
jgi:hypothetical protein